MRTKVAKDFDGTMYSGVVKKIEKEKGTNKALYSVT